MTSYPLMQLAAEARRRGTPVVLMAGRIVPLGSPAGEPLPLTGMRLGPTVDAVAAQVGFGRPGVAPSIVAADRHQETIVVDALLDAPFDVTGHGSVVVDTARRALGLPTPPPGHTVGAYLDAEWLHRILTATLDAPLGDPPHWPRLAGLHPAVTTAPVPTSPEHLAHRRARTQTDWASFRHGVIQRHLGWPPVGAALASWFDEGSLARHLLSQLPDPDVVLAELRDLLRPADHGRVAGALAP